jgi:hypothetical protein
VPSTHLRCDVAVPLAPGQPGEVTVDATFRDNEGNGGVLSDGMVLQVSSGVTPLGTDTDDRTGSPAPPPPARPTGAGTLPVTGAPLLERAARGLALLAAGGALLGVAWALPSRPHRRRG